MKTGPGRVTRFQSGFPGARTPAGPTEPPVGVSALGFGADQPWRLPSPPGVSEDLPQDIDRLVSGVQAAHAAAGIPEPRRPWLAPLATTYNLRRLPMRRDTALPLGIADDPATQSQEIVHFRPDIDRNLLVLGSGGSGKTTALRSMAVAASVTPGGGVVHVYGLDFAGGQLASLEALTTVGSVVPGEDLDRVRRLVAHLTDVTNERSRRFSAASASRLDQYRSLTSSPDEPRILVVLDGLGAFRSVMEGSAENLQIFSQFQRLLAEGPAVGVHFVVTADRSLAVPASLASAFGRRLVLRLSDSDEYRALGLPPDVLTYDSPPGRGVFTDVQLEVQLAVFLSDDAAAAGETSVAAQIRALESLASAVSSRHSERPMQIRPLPELVGPDEMPDEVGGRPVLGLEDASLAPIPFEPAGLVMISGPEQSGRTQALLWFAEAVRRWRPDTHLVHLSARPSPNTAADTWTRAADTGDDCLEVLDWCMGVVGDRTSQQPIAIFVEHFTEFVQGPCDAALMAVVQACKRNGHLLVAEAESPTWATYLPLITELRNARTGLLLQPDQSDGDLLLKTPLPRCRRADFPAGRGFWVRAGRAAKVQVPWLGASLLDSSVGELR